MTVCKRDGQAPVTLARRMVQDSNEAQDKATATETERKRGKPRSMLYANTNNLPGANASSPGAEPPPSGSGTESLVAEMSPPGGDDVTGGLYVVASG